jgi:hypothetical protein
VIVLINGGPALDRFGPTNLVGRLVSPRSGNKIRPGERWGADNDCLRAWDEGRYLRMLNRLDGVPGCLFVAVPDVVHVVDGKPKGDARATLDRFDDWRWEVAGRGFPPALVGQDGLEDLDVPWDAFDAFFIGGSTAWKLSDASADLAFEARRRGKHLHVGRVNSQKRMRNIWSMQPDSYDGTGYSMFPDKYLRRDLPYLAGLNRQAVLGLVPAGEVKS